MYVRRFLRSVKRKKRPRSFRVRRYPHCEIENPEQEQSSGSLKQPWILIAINILILLGGITLIILRKNHLY